MSDQHKLNLGSFNIRGLTKEYKQEKLSNDITKHKLDICCLQEIKLINGRDININDHILICACQQAASTMGMNLLFHQNGNITFTGTWKVSDRIPVIQLKLEEDEYICEEQKGINLHTQKVQHYAVNLQKQLKMKITKYNVKKLVTITFTHQLQRTENISNLDEMYSQLGTSINDFKNKNTSVLLITGDFNAKIDKSNYNEICLGKYSRGKRNNSGQRLIKGT